MKNILSTKLAVSTLLALLTGLTPEVSADIGSLNPLNIFRRTKKFENLTPTPEEQSISIAIYQEGKADLQSGKKARAARTFRKITKDFPHTDVAPNAFSRLGEIYRDTICPLISNRVRPEFVRTGNMKSIKKP